ncbi:Hypothetical protein SCF082_LOCUS705 [Durusdinium trenchii]|uniref:Uncharacterized protein n=1 Tax=Durusdinium trenchii TaxID=1381693 RepID=A0ABP0HAR9_9DINO
MKPWPPVGFQHARGGLGCEAVCAFLEQLSSFCCKHQLELSGSMMLVSHSLYNLASSPSPSSSSILPASVRGIVCGSARLTTVPSRSTRNLVKFHLMKAPIAPPFSFLRYVNSGCAPSPLTSIFSNIWKVTPKLSVTNLRITSGEPGSWPPNSLDGNARISSPRSLYSSYSCCNSL